MSPFGVLAHVLLGVGGSLAIHLGSVRASGATSFSAPSVIVLVGMLCATFASFLSPWATPGILLIYAVASLAELLRDRRLARSSGQAGRKPTG